MSRQNLEVVRRLYAALAQRDIDVMNELSHEHVRYKPRVGELRGRVYRFAELEDYFADVDEVWDDVCQSAMDLASIDDDRVVVTVRYQARAKASGVEVDQLLGVVVTLRGGKVERLDAYPSRQDALRAAGVAG